MYLRFVRLKYPFFYIFNYKCNFTTLHRGLYIVSHIGVDIAGRFDGLYGIEEREIKKGVCTLKIIIIVIFLLFYNAFILRRFKNLSHKIFKRINVK